MSGIIAVLAKDCAMRPQDSREVQRKLAVTYERDRLVHDVRDQDATEPGASMLR